MGNATLLIPSLVTVLVCLHASRLGVLLGLVDHPDGVRKQHVSPTPLIGGLAAVLPWSGAVAFGWSTGLLTEPVLLLALAGMSFLLIGMVDDRLGLRPVFRLLLGGLVVLVVAGVDPSFRLERLNSVYLAVPVQLDLKLALLFTIVVVVGFVNAVNMADGLNGLVPGLWAIWFGGALILAPPELVPALAMLLGCVLAVTVFNWHGRLFLGDAGSYAAAALAGLTAILLYNDVTVPLMTAGAAVAWFLVPVLDCLRMVALRLRLGRSPFAPDRGHLHHRLERRFGQRWAVLVYWAIVGIPVAATLLENFPGTVAVIVPVVLYVAALRATPAEATILPEPLTARSVQSGTGD